MLHRMLWLGGILGAVAVFSLVQAQEQGRPRRNTGAAQGPDRPAGRGGFDPAQMRERTLNYVKEQLGATDEEWKALKPKVEKVTALQRDARPGMGGFGWRRGGEEGGPAASPVDKAQGELRTLLEDKNASASDIAAKVAALREARKKARAELSAAQKALKEAVNPRQEAVLVLNGMLE